MLSPAERRTLAEIERQLAADDPALARHFPSPVGASAPARPVPTRLLLAARVLLAVLAAVAVVLAVLVTRIDLVVVCVVTLVATEAVLRRSM